jgi:hypothetical protein
MGMAGSFKPLQAKSLLRFMTGVGVVREPPPKLTDVIVWWTP